MTIRQAQALVAAALICVCARNAIGSDTKSGAATSPVRESRGFSINAETGSVAGIAVGMTESELRKSGWPYEVRSESAEGDEYKIYDVQLNDNVTLECWLDFKNVLARILISSPSVKDPMGLSVGASLKELRRAYAKGEFVFGEADGLYANFVAQKRIIFYFDPKDLSKSCFEDREKCKIDEFIRAKKIAVGMY